MKKIAYSLLAGIAVGTVVGILVAPDKGKRTQRKLLKKGKDVSDDLKDKFEDLIDSFKDNLDTTSDYIDKARSKYEKYMENVSDYTEKAKEKYASLRN